MAMIGVAEAGPTRSTTYTYDAATSQVATVDGPRTDVSDVTTYDYDPLNGNLLTVTNALGHLTEMEAHDAEGRPLRIVDPNGLVTALSYHPRGWVLSSTVGDETTDYDYDAVGQLIKVTLPDATYLEYVYDAARRLTEVRDHLGNRMTYTLDAMGNRTAETVHDGADVLRRSRTRVYNELNRLVEMTGGASQITGYDYDAQGNPTTSTDGRGHTTTTGFDALNRLISVTDPLTGQTGYTYDALDQVRTVTDPNGNVTTYTYNALGDLLKLESPDTKVRTGTYDAAGNRLTQTDARGVVTEYAYDALNRLLSIGYPRSPELNVTYHYDQRPNGKGRLTGLTDGSGSTEWDYDLLGRVTAKRQTVTADAQAVTFTTAYRYDAAGRIESMTYPSGGVVAYGYENGRLASIHFDGTPILTDITYESFGTISGWAWGDGSTHTRSYDLDGRLTTHTLAGDTRTLAYDLTDNITRIQDALDDVAYDYDALSRLTNAAGATSTRVYAYDANSNRTSLTLSENTPAGLMPHAAANTVRVYDYDAANRLASVEINGTVVGTYSYNALGQRVAKRADGVTTRYGYDDTGALLAEGQDGGVTREYIYLGGTPIAYRTGSPSPTLYLVHTDHLDTPKALTDTGGRLVWRAVHAPFGLASADEDPDGDSHSLVMNIRFPGQYFDQESGLHYNYHRYYDPSTGRYLRSDPIGLGGGTNTYGYVSGNPLGNSDPFGLFDIRAYSHSNGSYSYTTRFYSARLGEIERKWGPALAGGVGGRIAKWLGRGRKLFPDPSGVTPLDSSEARLQCDEMDEEAQRIYNEATNESYQHQNEQDMSRFLDAFFSAHPEMRSVYGGGTEYLLSEARDGAVGWK